MALKKYAVTITRDTTYVVKVDDELPPASDEYEDDDPAAERAVDLALGCVDAEDGEEVIEVDSETTDHSVEPAVGEVAP